ncbi:MAG: potassium channel family protein [Cuniculiplasma sp.]
MDLQTFITQIKKALKHNIGKTIIISMVVLIYSVISEYIIENPIPGSGIHSIFESLWWTMQTVTTVGYGDVTIVGFAGKLNAIFIMIIGVGSFSLLLVSIGAELIDAKLMKRFGEMRTKMKDHIIICNYSEKQADIIKSISEEKIPLIVLGQEPPQRERENMEFVKGNPLDYNDMKKAGIENSHTVIIFPNEKYGADDSLAIDAESILIVMTAKKLNPEINTIIELLNKTSQEHAIESGADEIIVRGEMSSSAIVKLIRNPGSWDFMSSLMSTPERMDIIEKREENLKGKTFKEIYRAIETENRKIIAIKQNDDYRLRPSDDTVYAGEPLIILEKSRETMKN